jgi:hypothetical protein
MRLIAEAGIDDAMDVRLAAQAAGQPADCIGCMSCIGQLAGCSTQTVTEHSNNNVNVQDSVAHSTSYVVVEARDKQPAASCWRCRLSCK